MQFFYALHFNDRRARAFNLGAHFYQQIGRVFHLRLARRVADNCFAFGQHGRHEQVFRACYGDAVKVNTAAT